MRSGRGKCPQCKETIVVDLAAAEIRCPLCNALLKKSKKTVAEVRAEEEARIAAAEARERALRGEPETPVQPEPEPVVEAPAEPVVETPAEEPVVETPAEEVAEAPAEAPVDEIGMTDEELAALDDVLPTDAEESTAVEPSAEAVDEIGLSDEELAAMDDVLPTDTEGAADAAPAEEASDADIDIPVADEPIEVAPADDADDDIAVTGSVSDEEDIAEADVAPAEDEEGDTSDEDTAGSLGSTYVIPDEAADEAPQVEIEDEPTEGAASPAPTEDASDADIDIPLADESAEETPIEEAAVEEAAVAESPDIEISEREESLAEETPVEEEVSAEETPAEEVPAEEETPSEEVEEVPAEPAAYTDEDMAFAASLSDGIAANDSGEKEGKKVGYVAPVNTAKPAKDRGNKADARAKKGDAPKGERNMSDSAIYKKPVAVIMMILAFIGAAVSLLLTTNVAVFAFISDSVGEKVIELVAELPEFLFDYAAAIFGGVVVLISILGLTGKRGKLGFLFALLAGLIYTANALFGGVAPVIEVEAIAKILADYGEYVGYAVYGLLLLAAIFFAVSINGGKEELEISGGTAALPIIYMLVAVVGTIALVILPRIMESFTVTTDILKYAILGIVGLSILLTLIGVHSKTASRGANAWLLFAAAMIVALIFGVITLVTKLIPEEKALDVLPAAEIFLCVSPCILFFPLIGYTISDLRN